MYLSNIKKWKVKSPYFTSVVRNSHQYQANKLDADSAFIFPTLPPSPDRIVGTVTPHKFDKTFVKQQFFYCTTKVHKLNMGTCLQSGHSYVPYINKLQNTAAVKNELYELIHTRTRIYPPTSDWHVTSPSNIQYTAQQIGGENRRINSPRMLCWHSLFQAPRLSGPRNWESANTRNFYYLRAWNKLMLT